MQFFANINIKPLEPSISYRDKIVLTGSCFTEHIGNFLIESKFNALQNPNGILFDPQSVASSLLSYIENKAYAENDLFYLNEAWNSWQHHSRFSNIDKEACLNAINNSQQQAHAFLKHADWLIITLGSAFTYKLVQGSAFYVEPNEVANCHKAPAQNFIKHLNTIEEIITTFDTVIHRLFYFNPKLKIIFTISPVRHLRDGVVDNNRSKARLIEAVHHLVNKFDKLYYFPAYELVIDVLRDYRFYDVDLAHPNYAATQFVLDKFSETCFSQSTKELVEEIKKIVIAKKHKPFNSQSSLHKKFLQQQLEKAKDILQRHPYLNLEEEIKYFSKG
ncbi:GSCFA domain-containing protein [Parafilimonas terrae]|uniref:GSCFA family protein n=1 Tax=Parafilimonas terrae TaxID=1465490 RepID=A0A1I5SNJ7_9BACT|nr:GSCFA domain-containing protein [Parafilimonas terrae]SFP71876.1 GSCFA family protein [Parafilimonas terrae]